MHICHTWEFSLFDHLQCLCTCRIWDGLYVTVISLFQIVYIALSVNPLCLYLCLCDKLLFFGSRGTFIFVGAHLHSSESNTQVIVSSFFSPALSHFQVMILSITLKGFQSVPPGFKGIDLKDLEQVKNVDWILTWDSVQSFTESFTSCRKPSCSPHDDSQSVLQINICSQLRAFKCLGCYHPSLNWDVDSLCSTVQDQMFPEVSDPLTETLGLKLMSFGAWPPEMSPHLWRR